MQRAKQVTNRGRKTPRQELVEDATYGTFSIVLGAGISIPYGVPSWDESAKKLWQVCFPKSASPWENDPTEMYAAQTLPQFLPMVFERAFNLDPDEFLRQLRSVLYSNYKHPTKREIAKSNNSLAVLARLLIKEFRSSDRRRIRRVITFNIDDLLQQAVQSLAARNERPVVTIGRASDLPVDKWHPNSAPIPIYHLHGLVHTKEPVFDDTFAHNLVFTDAQYWDSTSALLSYPNRTMGMALHDSHCLFIGLSMTDVNLLRWLAIRRNEFIKDNTERLIRQRAKTVPRASKYNRAKIKWRTSQHYWIRPSDKPSTRFMSEFLETRGVRSVEIEAWTGEWFEELIETCFGSLKL